MGWKLRFLVEMAVFGGGCFWCLEAVFAKLKGVESVIPGYAGGWNKKPTYEKVCSGKTGEKNPDQAYCQIHIPPKIAKLREKFEKLVK
jgi:peptide-methionine (S)-S-oxide reductase